MLLLGKSYPDRQRLSHPAINSIAQIYRHDQVYENSFCFITNAQFVRTAKDEIYPFEYAANLKLESFRTDEEFVKGLLAEGQSEGDQEEKPEKPEEETKGKKGGRKAGGAAPTKKAAGKKLKEVLFKMVPCFHQAMIDNLLRENGLNPNGKATEEHTQQLIKIAKDSIKFLLDFQNSNPKGYLSIKAPKADKKPEEKKPEQQEQQITTEKPENQEAKPEEQKAPEESYIEFSPIPIAGAAAVKELPTFDEAVDTFFIKSQPPVVSKQEEKEKLAWKKFENIKVGSFAFELCIEFMGFCRRIKSVVLRNCRMSKQNLRKRRF